MIEPFYSRADTSLVFGEPIDLSDYHAKRLTREVLEEVTTLMMWKLAELGETEYLGSPRPDSQTAVIPIPSDRYHTAN